MDTLTLEQLRLRILDTPAALPADVQTVLLDQIADGNGMNPALHNYWVAIHPPMLYLGFVGFTIPFGWAVGSLISGEVGEGWLRPIRLWTMGAWCFLTVGIALGGLWAYEILGWGGYWAWDPVENASFIPWLTGTAFIHSVIVTERRGLLRAWTFALVIITYCMTVIGTFLVRSGIINSVHAFGATGEVDQWFYAFLGIVFVGSLLALVWRLPLLKTERKLDSLLSREGSFLLNNLAFLGIAIITLVITFWPWITKKLYGEGGVEELGQDAFVMFNIPLFLAVLVLMGIGPALAWRQNSLRSVVRALTIPALVGLVVGLVNAIWLGANDLLVRTDQPDKIAALAAWVRLIVQLSLWPICAFTFTCVLREFISGAKARAKNTHEGFIVALYRVVLANRRRFGGYVVHVGVLLVALGIYYSSLYQGEGTITAQPGGFGVITDPLTGREFVAYYAEEHRSSGWNVVEDAWGRSATTAETYGNMLRKVRGSPGKSAGEIVDKILADARAQNNGQLPPMMEQGLPRMIQAINWGVDQRDNPRVYETFDTSLFVFPYKPGTVATDRYIELHDKTLRALAAMTTPHTEPLIVPLMTDLRQGLLTEPGQVYKNLAEARRNIEESKDEVFVRNSGIPAADAERAGKVKAALIARIDAFFKALDELSAEGVKLGVSLPGTLRQRANDVALLPDDKFAALFGLDAGNAAAFVPARFSAMKELEAIQGLFAADAVRLRNERVENLAKRIAEPEAWSELVTMRPLSLAGLLHARENAEGEAAEKIGAEIDAITEGAIRMAPRMRIFYDKLSGAPRKDEAVKDPYYRRSINRDLYFILQDAQPDGTATLRFFVKPHMTLGLCGLFVLVGGAVFAFLPSMRRRRIAA